MEQIPGLPAPIFGSRTDTRENTPLTIMRQDRSVRIDKLRWLAILLMALDHVISVIDPENLARYTLTRADLPIFMLISGYLLADRNPTPKRYAQLLAASFCSLIIVQYIPGMAKADLLLVISIVLAIWPIARRVPVIALCIGAVQSQTLGLWDGYQPGYLLALMCTGLLLVRITSKYDNAIAVHVAQSPPRLFTVLGKKPLAIYLIHLVILAIHCNTIAAPRALESRHDYNQGYEAENIHQLVGREKPGVCKGD